jgi:hypothetical protein
MRAPNYSSETSQINGSAVSPKQELVQVTFKQKQVAPLEKVIKMEKYRR